MIYYGCIGDTGHFFWGPGGVRLGVEHPFSRLFGTPEDLVPNCPRDIQGLAALVHQKGWTVLAFCDRSVDRRPGSVSAFGAEGTHSFDEMVAQARSLFPSVWARFRFEVTLAEDRNPHRMIYFGCIGSPGHFIWDECGRTSYYDTHPFPNAVGSPEALVPAGHSGPEGLAALVHKNGWTALAFCDRSVDTRKGCVSVFALRGGDDWDFAKMVEEAKRVFPRVWKRFKFEVKLAG